MTEQFTIILYALSVTLSEGAKVPKSKGLDMAEHSPVQFNTVHADLIVETPRCRSASLGVTAFVVMLSGGAASPAVETSRPIGTFTHHEPHTQCAASEGRNVRVQSFARGGCGLPAQSAESAGYHLERSRRRSERLDTAEHSSVQFKTVHTGTTVEAFGTFTLAICMGSCSSDRRDPAISLRYTRDDRTMHNSQLFCTLLLSCRAEGRKARSRDIPTLRNFYPYGSHGFTLVPPSGPLDFARGDRPEWLRLARGDKKMHIFCCKSGKMYYLWDKRSAGKARFALLLS